MHRTVSAMPKTIHGAATIRSLQVICAVRCCPVVFRDQCTRRACLAGEGAMVMAWNPHGTMRAGGTAQRRANGAMAATVLVVEDEPKLRDLVRSYLERARFTVLSTGSGAEAITMASGAAPGLVVLDLGLPDVPGETVARELRAVAATPILMLTAKTTEEDRIRGLELGADDYVTKPLSPRELVLRVQAVLRRGGRAADRGVTSYGGGELVIDEPRRAATVRGAPAELTPAEWGILVALATVPGRVYSRSELISRVRGHEFEGYERSVDSHVKNLRRKIEEDPAGPRIIQTVLGGGYRLGLARGA
jgi:DNA-binding response OmpR family regulator